MIFSIVEIVVVSLCHIYKDFWSFVADPINDRAERSHGKGGSYDNKKVTFVSNFIKNIHEFFGELLSKECDFWFDRTSTFFFDSCHCFCLLIDFHDLIDIVTVHDSALRDTFFEFVLILLFSTFGTLCSKISSMRLIEIFGLKSRF